MRVCTLIIYIICALSLYACARACAHVCAGVTAQLFAAIRIYVYVSSFISMYKHKLFTSMYEYVRATKCCYHLYHDLCSGFLHVGRAANMNGARLWGKEMLPRGKPLQTM